MMPNSKECRAQLQKTKDLVEERGYKFEVVDIEMLRKHDEIAGLHLHGLPTVRREGHKDIFGRYSREDLEAILAEDIDA